jgi:hypothetical protein
MKKEYFAMRSHSHTDRQMLWKVLSRPLHDLDAARFEAEHHKNLAEKSDNDFFVVERINDTIEALRPIKVDGIFYDVPPDIQSKLYGYKRGVDELCKQTLDLISNNTDISQAKALDTLLNTIKSMNDT